MVMKKKSVSKVVKPVRNIVKQEIKKETNFQKLVTEKEIAMDFAIKVHEKFDRLIKASVLFGSQTKGTETAHSDIDIVLIVDDASIHWDMELVAWYREELGKLVSSLKYSKELHINTIKLTAWWQDLLEGDPVVINIVRYGEVLIDSGGFFNPIKALLLDGKIYSTPEAAYTALRRAPEHLLRSKASKLGSIEGVYWCFVDASQAALIMVGKLPPSPEHIPKMLKEAFVDRKLLNEKYVRAMSDLYALHKQIAHGDLRMIKGEEIDKWQMIAESYLGDISRVIDSILESKKN